MGETEKDQGFPAPVFCFILGIPVLGLLSLQVGYALTLL